MIISQKYGLMYFFGYQNVGFLFFKLDIFYQDCTQLIGHYSCGTVLFKMRQTKSQMLTFHFQAYFPIYSIVPSMSMFQATGKA